MATAGGNRAGVGGFIRDFTQRAADTKLIAANPPLVHVPPLHEPGQETCVADIPSQLAEALAERYSIEGTIGSGGTATVYRARDERHSRTVAIKVLRPQLAETVGPARFLREIEIAAGLTHPHILPLHDSGEADGYLYYVMPFIEGESLRGLISREGALPVAQAARIFRQIVDALGAAHDRGLVHRDVKPENVLLSGGHALVADFGVAKAVTEAGEAGQLTTMGVAIGTPQYMAPEQATADPDMDHRADIFAAGAILYEMLTGRAAFQADTTRAVLAAVLAKTPESPRAIRGEVPEGISELAMECLEKDPAKRPQSATEVLARLDARMAPTGRVPAWERPSVRRRGRKLMRVWLPAVAIVAVIGYAGMRWFQAGAAERQARNEWVPAVLDLVGQNRMAEAADLALRAESVLGRDAVLEPLWPLMSSPFRVESDPPGATLLYRPFESDADAWESLGSTPFESDRFPVGAFRFRLEMEGFEPTERVRSLIPASHLQETASAGYDYMADASYVLDVGLTPGVQASDMITVSGGLYGTTPIIGFPSLSPVPIPQYQIDRTEVTNGEFGEFVAAGGYDAPEYWDHPFERDGETLSFDQAMLVFQDSTGQTGPSTWLLGQPPQGRESHPVTGISWFEAAAYCRWQGKELPTLYHWARATLPSTDVWMPFNHLLAEASNFDDAGPEPVGTRDAIGISGAQDLVGNVREWVSTAGGTDRYLLGGAWSDPEYMVHDAFPVSPWRRDATEGVRCARFPEGESTEHLQAPRVFPAQDFSGTGVAMPDEVFERNLQAYAYDRTIPLSDSVESRRSLDWGATEEWVSINAAYGGQRLPIRLHIPDDAEPPYEAIIFLGAGDVIRSTRIAEPKPPIDFLVRSGRVLVQPIYDGTFQRNDGRTLQRISGPGVEELIAHWIQDIGRTIDYLEARPDFDGSRISYFGLSLGAGVAPRLLPYEPRFRAAILYSGGFGVGSSQASTDRTIALLQRIQVPVLQLGGRHDFSTPVDPYQTAFFGFLGTPPEDKRQVIFDSGHQPLPLNGVIRESVSFLERYVGAR